MLRKWMLAAVLAAFTALTFGTGSALAVNTMNCDPVVAASQVHHEPAGSTTPNGYFWSTDGVDNCHTGSGGPGTGAPEPILFFTEEVRLKSGDGLYVGPWVMMVDHLYFADFQHFSAHYGDYLPVACPLGGSHDWSIESRYSVNGWNGGHASILHTDTSFGPQACTPTAIW